MLCISVIKALGHHMPQEKYNPNIFLLYFVSVLHPQYKLCATGSHSWDASQLWPSSAVIRCIVQCQETFYVYCSVVRHIPLWVSGLPGHTVDSMWETADQICYPSDWSGAGWACSCWPPVTFTCWRKWARLSSLEEWGWIIVSLSRVETN